VAIYLASFLLLVGSAKALSPLDFKRWALHLGIGKSQRRQLKPLGLCIRFPLPGNGRGARLISQKPWLTCHQAVSLSPNN
jgi:hypothetical protein